MPTRQPRRSAAFSLVELIIVVVIIGLLAAIAIPRFSQGAANASENAYVADLAVLRNAIELYAAEHGAFPSATSFTDQLTTFTNEAGGAVAEPAPGYDYGPYLVAVPELKVGDAKGNAGVEGVAAKPTTVSSTAGVGWLYHEASGRIWGNAAGRF
ncbi:prepilin-type N-terminal cleavage/methylation domain-containing protein [Phycisphaera mikurensis]|uniref:Putative fimbrial protein n=1 Tax=Phycisphaera mikurensis (strain NBRC 102666 / KCTC 22515 / FYK2301M01) TaxID=1142394 RepID=I0II76_PHYMF|nr:prepilin-type N-terminal cleavage/methylation domain-containing protein [Phycisphaera mikurensis]MBB6442473.1 prepilin-type N-terminal cleavage/methylation domain-containing protein [Phycisphaera mikurensis]BAM04964.1 putative fimbrial protein [Phycisphaera mikurensis NBRC 102666]